MLNFAHGDAEAPPAVFLFHRYTVFVPKTASWRSCLNLPLQYPSSGGLRRATYAIVKDHWSIESFHWSLDRNLLLDDIKRKSPWAARNLATMQRIVHGLYYIWKGRHRKKSDKAKGVAELMRPLALSFTKLMRFLSQK